MKITMEIPKPNGKTFLVNINGKIGFKPLRIILSKEDISIILASNRIIRKI